MKKLYCALYLLIFCFGLMVAQVIKGKITDSNHQPIPFATVFISKLLTGTTANLQGEYHLNVPAGQYKVTYRCLGYRETSKDIQINGTETLDIILPLESFAIKEVTVTRGGEDLAYGIMRKAIAWSSFHLNEVNHYESEVYLKGSMSIDKIPKLLKSKVAVADHGKVIKIKSGDVYLDESVNQIFFDAPNTYKHKVLSVRSTFPASGNQPITPIDLIKTSFYQKQMLEIISPLAPTAFSEYKFHYEGFQKDGDLIIDKIKVTPLRKSQELFEGYIYIVEDFWSLYSVDLLNEQFWGKIQIKQQFAMVKGEAWLPVSDNFIINVDYMGIKMSFTYVASVKLSALRINETLKGPIAIMEEKQYQMNKESSRKAEALLANQNISKKELRKIMRNTAREARKKELADRMNTRDTLKSLEIKPEPIRYTMDSMATKRDTSYWNKIRPVPLITKEIKSFEKKDSLEKIDNPKTKEDSLNAKKSKRNFITNLLFNYTWHTKNSKISFTYDGLAALKYLNFNTVDGVVVKQGLHLTLNADSLNQITLSAIGGYAFSRRAFLGKSELSYSYLPLKNGRFSMAFNSSSSDYNEQSGIGNFYNAATTLLLHRNYMKLFNEKSITLKNEIDIQNGLRLFVSARYMQADPLTNHTTFALIYPHGVAYTSNTPINNNLPILESPTFRSFKISGRLTYTPEYFYKIENHHKHNLYSRYPTFYIEAKAAIPDFFKSEASYQFIAAGMNQSLNLKTNHQDEIHYELSGGSFLNTKRMHFSEFNHFNIQEGPLSLSDFSNAFQLLHYYRNSTDAAFMEGHMKYTTSLLLLKRLPLISNRIWKENVYLNFIKISDTKPYTEVGYGLGQLFLLGEIGIFAGFDNLKFNKAGVKVSLHF